MRNLLQLTLRILLTPLAIILGIVVGIFTWLILFPIVQLVSFARTAQWDDEVWQEFSELPFALFRGVWGLDYE